MAAVSIMAVLDSIPTSKIKAVGGQGGVRKASRPSFRKSCPQPYRIKFLHEHSNKLGKESRPAQRKTHARKRLGARTASSAAHPLY
jgi:hypothetical protein